MSKGIFNHWSFYVYTVLMLLVSIYSFKRTEYNWDIFPYMAVILRYDGNADFEKVHKNVYSIAKQTVSAEVYNKLTGSTSDYRKTVFADPAEFNRQLPFYVVKPLYTGLAYLSYKSGLTLPQATVFPSALSFLLISLLVFAWFRKYRSRAPSFVFSTLLMLCPFMLEAVKLSTPDMLSAFLLLAAVYSYIEKNSFDLTALFLLLAVFARLDNIIPLTLIILAIFYLEKRNGSLVRWKFVLFGSLVLASYLFISWQAYRLGWGILFYPDFASHLNPYYDTHRPFTFSGYFSLLRSQLMTGLYYSSIVIFFFLGYFLFHFSKISHAKTVSVEAIFTIIFLIVIITRFILQPVMADRFYLAYYLAVLIFLLKRINPELPGKLATT